MMRSKKIAEPALKVDVEQSPGAWSRFMFEKPFKIGRQEDCELCIDDSYVSRVHAAACVEDGHWVLRDLNSANGIYRGQERMPVVRILSATAIRLGIDGPVLRMEEVSNQVQVSSKKRGKKSDAQLAEVIHHYFSHPSAEQPAGERTMFIRQAFAQVETKRKRKSAFAISALLVLLAGAGIFAFEQHRQLEQQRATAENIFYSIKTQDVDLANLDRTLSRTNERTGGPDLSQFRSRRQSLEDDYNKYLATLHIYNPKMTEQQRLVLRVARIFGECELDMPADFQNEINRYIDMWRSSGRLKQAVQTAQQNGYTRLISKELVARGLPPQFFYLALQESNFNQYAVGPMTHMGYAKGMWQFIPATAVKYQLHLGPLVDQPRLDTGDDRHDYKKETKAAALYLQDLYGSDAQASGFLVMACYNWGENQVLPLVRSMPANPKERNFWKLLSKHRDKIPAETYNYVFSIASAAVIGENPRLFGFDFDNPLLDTSMTSNGTIETQGPAIGN